jgi:hypothetical protein
VDDDVPQIDQDPPAVVIPFGSSDRETVVAGGLRDRVGDRASLDFRAASDDHERVGDDGAALEIEDREIFALLVFGGGTDGCEEVRQCRAFQ